MSTVGIVVPRVVAGFVFMPGGAWSSHDTRRGSDELPKHASLGSGEVVNALSSIPAPAHRHDVAKNCVIGLHNYSLGHV